MVLRTRTRNDNTIVGYTSSVGGIPCVVNYYNETYHLKTSVCIDNVLPGDGHPFSVTTRELYGEPLHLSGFGCGGVPMDRIKDIYTAILANDESYTHCPVNGRPTDGELAAKLVADTNPSRPVVDLPVFVAQLGEIPRLFKGYGDNIFKNIANANLSYQFGIKPLVSDLMSLLNFQDEFAKRERELKALASGGLRCKRTLWSGSGQYSAERQTFYDYPFARHQIQRNTSEKVWGFCRWVPSSNMPTTEDAIRNLAKRAVLGLTFDFASAWELIPWSWLIDWCSSAGNFLQASRNIVPCSVTDVLIMSHKVTEMQAKKTWSLDANLQGGDINSRLSTGSRSPATPTLSAHLPVLSLRQLSILGSIGMQRYR